MANNSISKYEIILYFVVWICSIGYSIYQTYKVGNDYFSNNLYDTFTDGWPCLNRKKDNSDYEWKFGLELLATLIPWYIIHFIGTEILKKYKRHVFLPFWFSIIGLVFTVIQLGLKATLYFTFQPVFGYFIVYFKRKSLIWIYNLLSLIVLNYFEFFYVDFSYYEDYEIHIIISTMAWINLRCLNYFLEIIDDTNLRKIKFQNILYACAYCFYLPLLFYGPLVLFANFRSVFNQADQGNFTKKIKQLVCGLFRFSSWLFFTEFALHFVYVNAMSYETELIANMNYWALYGLGYCMGQMFHLKYVVFYGLSTNLAKFENVLVPNIPKCIGRIHLYSDMWKYFDQGLYLFLLRYIYIPVCRHKRTLLFKIFASFLCFLYVYIWHGIQNFIAIWAILNFVGIIIEILSYKIYTLPFLNKISLKLSPAMRKRFICAVTTPLFAMSALSNFYFFAGKDVGDIYIGRFLKGPSTLIFIILSVLYCGSNVSVEIKQWEIAEQKH